MASRSLIVLLVLALGAPMAAAQPAPDSGTINIMTPEKIPPVKNKKLRKKAHGSSNPVYPAPLPRPQAPLAAPQQQAVTPRQQQVPPPLLVPETGRVLPNLAPPGGVETSQERAARCAHQAGVYGPNTTGDPGSYIRGCINQ